MLSVPYRKQAADYLCGPAVMQMVLAFYGKRIDQARLARLLKTSRRYGTARKQLIRIAKKFNLEVQAQHHGTIDALSKYVRKGSPVIVNYIEPTDNEGHYAVVVGFRSGRMILNDPYNGKHFRISKRDFLKRWRGETPAGARSARWWMIVQPIRNVR
jgi:ABC-type bacteriocin/lantibiotic exporter with double-glycine peptidase domain